MDFKDQFESFLAEVDALASGAKISSEIAVPHSKWVVHVDSNSNFPFYHNPLTNESCWEMPSDYRSYLDQYEKFIKLSTTKCLKNTAFQELSVRNLNARKRRRLKRAKLRGELSSPKYDADQIEYLSEYIAYSNSSGSDSDDGTAVAKVSSNADELSREVPSITLANNVDNSASNDFDSQSRFIGPVLPQLECLNDIILNPRLSPRSSSDEAFLVDKSEPDANACYDLPLNETDDSLYVETQYNSLKERFIALGIQTDGISILQVLYIQLATRYEDWRSGFLDGTWFIEKLKEIESFVNEFIDASTQSEMFITLKETDKTHVLSVEGNTYHKHCEPLFENIPKFNDQAQSSSQSNEESARNEENISMLDEHNSNRDENWLPQSLSNFDAIDPSTDIISNEHASTIACLSSQISDVVLRPELKDENSCTFEGAKNESSSQSMEYFADKNTTNEPIKSDLLEKRKKLTKKKLLNMRATSSNKILPELLERWNKNQENN